MRSFSIDRTEVSNAAYARFLQDNLEHRLPGTASIPVHRRAWKSPAAPEGLEEHPITLVTLDDARAYCSWAGARLPTALEWVYAAGGTEGLVFPWGDAWQDGTANWFEDRWASVPAPDSFEQTAPVGSFPAGVSSFGVHDLAGNVEEWVEPPSSDATSPGLLAGGSWFDNHPYGLRSDSIRPVRPDTQALTAGFRCARD